MKTNLHSKYYSVTIYFFLTFAISWAVIFFLTGPANFPINPEKSGDILPLLYVSMLLGPSIAGLLMISITKGKSGLIELFLKLVKWRVKIRWYLIAVLTTPIVAFLILSILSLISPQFQPEFLKPDNSTSVILVGIIIGLMVGIFEEIGWSGFAIPQLNKRYNIVITGIIVGIIWGAWHFILFWEMNSFSKSLPFLILIGRLFAWLLPFRIFMIWIFKHTGSLLLVVLTHMSLVFTTTVIVPMTLSGEYLLIWLITWGTVLWLILFLLHKMKALK